MPKPGDLVVVYNIGKSESLAVWGTWEGPEELLGNYWPKIIGRFCKNDVAILLEIYSPLKGSIGAKIYTEKSVVGWVSIKHIRSITV